MVPSAFEAAPIATQPRPRRDQSLEIAPVQLAGTGDHARRPHRYAALARERLPRRDVGMVVEFCDNDFVCRAPAAAERPCHMERQRGHVRAEPDFVGCGADESRQPCARARERGVGFLARRITPVGIRVVVQQIIGHRVGHHAGHLRAAGAVEIGDALRRRACARALGTRRGYVRRRARSVKQARRDVGMDVGRMGSVD